MTAKHLTHVSTSAGVPQEETIAFSLAFSLGNIWSRLGDECTADLIAHVGGSRGLSQLVRSWGKEFKSHLAGFPEQQLDDFSAELDLFVITSLVDLITAAGREHKSPPAPAYKGVSSERLAGTVPQLASLIDRFVLACPDIEENERLSGADMIDFVTMWVREAKATCSGGGLSAEKASDIRRQ
jgi:hypothetical protein